MLYLIFCGIIYFENTSIDYVSSREYTKRLSSPEYELALWQTVFCLHYKYVYIYCIFNVVNLELWTPSLKCRRHWWPLNEINGKQFVLIWRTKGQNQCFSNIYNVIELFHFTGIKLTVCNSNIANSPFSVRIFIDF